MFFRSRTRARLREPEPTRYTVRKEAALRYEPRPDAPLLAWCYPGETLEEVEPPRDGWVRVLAADDQGGGWDGYVPLAALRRVPRWFVWRRTNLRVLLLAAIVVHLGCTVGGGGGLRHLEVWVLMGIAVAWFAASELYARADRRGLWRLVPDEELTPIDLGRVLWRRLWADDEPGAEEPVRRDGAEGGSEAPSSPAASSGGSSGGGVP